MAEHTAHWDDVYRRKPVDTVSWYHPHLEMSLALLAQAGVSPTSRLIDIGGGASTLVDDLLARGTADVTVLDLSANALDVSRRRLGDAASRVEWLVGDIRDVALPAAGFDFWHDRAVLHFLTDPDDVRRYAAQAASAVCIGGHAVIGGFAPDGPERCSGLPVARRSARDIAAALSPHFRLLDARDEIHRTPAGNEQPFAWALLERTSGLRPR